MEKERQLSLEELFKDGLPRTVSLSEKMILLAPIANELCPKVFRKLAHYDGAMDYAIQGAILAEIKQMKSTILRLQKRVNSLERKLQTDFFE